jgi:hypothetical protein
MARGAAEVTVLIIEQAVGVDAANVEGHAGGEGFHQLFARKRENRC